MRRPRIMNKRIEYLGKTFDTINWTPDLSDEECEVLRQQYYEKPNMYDVRKEMYDIHRGSNKISKITTYYVKDLMSKVHIYHSYWSLEEVWNNNDLIRHYYAKTFKNDKVYTNDMPTIKKIETAMRIAGKPAAAKPTNFPLQGMRDILSKYNQNGSYYDFSCGWGVRMLGAMSMRVKYYGTDPNTELTKRLESLRNEYIQVNGKSIPKPQIFAHGSQETIDSIHGNVGLAFSSPPYFFLEDYKIGKQSYIEGMTLDEWNDTYLLPTMQNIKTYLTSDGYFLLNIKNFLDYDLVGLVQSNAKRLGFYYHGTETLKNITRRKMDNTPHETSDEPILIFSKHLSAPTLNSQNTLETFFQ